MLQGQRLDMQTLEMNGIKTRNVKDTKNIKEKKDFVGDSGCILKATQSSVDDFEIGITLSEDGGSLRK